MATRPLKVKRHSEQFLADDERVIPRYLDFRHPPRVRAIFRRAMKIPRRDVPAMLEKVMATFACRHRDLTGTFEDNYQQAARHWRGPSPVSQQHRLLIGAYFTMEYSIEAAALFNPSIVPHPDQTGLPKGSVRFLMSMRATGEGHVSSIVFRRGVIDAAGRLSFDPPPRYAYSARPSPNRLLAKAGFCRKLRELGTCEELAEAVLDSLPESFTAAQLRSAIQRHRRAAGAGGIFRELAARMIWLAEANYELRFPPDCLPSEIVIFPATTYEQRGMEDLRLVRFVGDGGQVRYYGTYAAYDGRRTHPMLLETTDFQAFEVHTLSGRYARNKGHALFPRKVDGCYLMLSRHDGENLFLLRSRNLYVWNTAARLQGPAAGWDLVQVGNSGSPLETEAGWLVLTHGVGPMRQYCIGACLLDRGDPTRLIGRLKEPLLEPTAAEREGYVPNVVYSCGSMIHGRRLIIPYAMSDSRTSFASVSLRGLLGRLRKDGAPAA